MGKEQSPHMLADERLPHAHESTASVDQSAQSEVNSGDQTIHLYEQENREASGHLTRALPRDAKGFESSGPLTMPHDPGAHAAGNRIESPIAIDEEQLMRTLLDRVRACDEGQVDSLDGPFTAREQQFLLQIMNDRYRDRINDQRIERKRLKSVMGKREFARSRRRHELSHLFTV